MATPALVIKFQRFQKWYQALKARGTHVPKAMITWRNMYASYIRRRFVKASRGDGTWPPLAPSTIARRRKNSSVILRDTGLLFAHVSPEFMPVTQFTLTGTKFTAAVDFIAEQQYPEAGVTVRDVLGFHQKGGGNLPQRKILVPPDAQTHNKMCAVMKKAIIKDVGT